MLLRHKLLTLTAVLALSAGVAMTAQAATDAVVATVNGTKIHKKDVDNAVKELGPRLKGVDQKQVFPMVVDQIINEKLLDDAATAAKIDTSKDFQQRLEVMKAQLVKQMYFERLLKTKVSDKQVRAAYDEFKNENKDKVEIHARHILVSSEEEAKQAIKDLDAGKKFEDIAKQRSAGPNAQVGGDLGWFVKDEMIAAFSDVAFKLKPGTYSKEPVKTELGWHVIKVEDKRERQVPKFEEVEMAIRNKLSQQALVKVVQELRAKADVKLYGPNGEEVPNGAAPAKDDKKSDAKKDDAKKDSDKKDAPKNAAQELEEKEKEKSAE
ncbi:MAG TPA: peptidylprolyl isomerase [Patescibacteria group bacterium]|nr:peptidylprolyl isomerase [Patescibacteria group bacterium]